MRRLLPLTTLMLALALAFAPSAGAAEALNVYGDATAIGGGVQLTSNATSQVGAAYTTVKKRIENGFVAEFRFRIHSPTGLGADGIAFVIQNGLQGAFGQAGGWIGYDIPNSVAVEFDTFLNVENGDPNNNHISVHSNGTSTNSPLESDSLGSQSPVTNMSDGALHSVKVTYGPSGLTVKLDSNPALTVAVNLSSLLSLPTGRAWVGFTSATGGDTEVHEVYFTRFRSLT
jgi:hypothetical protein